MPATRQLIKHYILCKPNIEMYLPWETCVAPTPQFLDCRVGDQNFEPLRLYHKLSSTNFWQYSFISPLTRLNSAFVSSSLP